MGNPKSETCLRIHMQISVNWYGYGITLAVIILAALSAYYLWKRKLQNKETARFLRVPEELRLSGKGMEDADLSMEEKYKT
ncbi:UNVERIFIED_CONTAM: hypothetical protein NY100_16465, partial [Prevotella sp. 15_C9]